MFYYDFFKPKQDYWNKAKWADLGSCNFCHQRIYIHRADLEMWQKERYKRIKKVVVDKPIWGTTRIVPLPPWPCGHSFLFPMQCYKRPDGRYEYW
jgi:hypothetical protein